MRSKVARELRKAVINKRNDTQVPISMETMYWQDPRTQVIRRISTCVRSVYQQAKRNYKNARSNTG